MRIRRLAVLTVIAATSVALPADASRVTLVCTASERWVFDPPLSLPVVGGTVVRSYISLCEEVGVVTSPGPGAHVVPFSGSSSVPGSYTGNCGIAAIAFADGFNGVLIGGTTYHATGYHSVASYGTVVLTPDAVCNERVATGYHVGVEVP